MKTLLLIILLFPSFYQGKVEYEQTFSVVYCRNDKTELIKIITEEENPDYYIDAKQPAGFILRVRTRKGLAISEYPQREVDVCKAKIVGTKKLEK